MGSFLRAVRVHTRVVTMVTNPSPFAQDFLSLALSLLSQRPQSLANLDGCLPERSP